MLPGLVVLPPVRGAAGLVAGGAAGVLDGSATTEDEFAGITGVPSPSGRTIAVATPADAPTTARARTPPAIRLRVRRRSPRTLIDSAASSRPVVCACRAR